MQTPEQKAAEYQANKVERDAKTLARYKQYRREQIERYGNKCACCGEDHYEFLTFDHINNDGAEHRRVTKGDKIVWLLRRSEYRDDIRVLCWNCNCSRQYHGVCVHAHD